MTAPGDDKDRPARGLFLVLSLDNLLYGVAVFGVREILPMAEITPVPKAPALIKGVLNLRGTIIPIFDLRRKLKLPERQPDVKTCIVVMEGEEKGFGFLADRVIDCLEIAEISHPQESDPSVTPDMRYIHGIGQYENGIVILLDFENILSSADRKTLRAI